MPALRTLPSATARPPGSRRGESSLLWLGLAIAFSPTLLDLAAHLGESAWARYALVFPLLFARCLARGERVTPRPSGTLWVVAGLCIELVAAFAGAIRWARPGLALAVFGLCRRQGLASWRVCGLIFFAVPAPAFLLRMASPELPPALVDGIAGLWRSTGLEVSFRHGALQGPHGVLPLQRVEGVEELAILAPLVAGLAWYDVALRAGSLRGAIAVALGLGVLAVGIQALTLVLAVGATAAGWPGAAETTLTQGTWIAVAVLAAATTEWRLRSA